MLPPWLVPIVATLPLWVQWLVPAALQMVVNYLLPALEKALPAEAQLLRDLAAWLSGKPPSGALLGAYQHFHQLKAAEPKQP